MRGYFISAHIIENAEEPFAGASAKYLGERNGVLVKERGNEWKKERFTISASLCGGGDLLKALGSVAHYFADGIFYSTNDN